MDQSVCALVRSLNLVVESEWLSADSSSILQTTMPNNDRHMQHFYLYSTHTQFEERDSAPMESAEVRRNLKQ